MVAVRPIASVHDFVLAEYLPKLIEYSPVGCEIGNDTPIFLVQDLRQLDEDPIGATKPGEVSQIECPSLSRLRGSLHVEGDRPRL